MKGHHYPVCLQPPHLAVSHSPCPALPSPSLPGVMDAPPPLRHRATIVSPPPLPPPPSTRSPPAAPLLPVSSC